MLNNPFLVEKARRLGRVVQSLSDPLNEVHWRLFARPISPEERGWCDDFLAQAGEDKGSGAEAAWTLLCQTLIISNDFIYIR